MEGLGSPLEKELTFVPANEASADDLDAIFGTRGEPAKCQCQWFKHSASEYRAMTTETRAALLREQTECGHPEAETTTGIVAYLDGEPVGWCAVEPRTAYPRLATARIPWAGRREDPADEGVWSVTCFVVRAGFRQQGIGRALAQASVDFARERGARSLEGYALIPEPGREVMWGELFVGSRSMFAAAGFAEVSRPSPRRAVMRIDF
jgi:GNAT superfamily N-acetyltransferase